MSRYGIGTERFEWSLAQPHPYSRGGSSMELFFFILTPALSLSKEREK